MIGGRGLWNCGNTCFLNATIQCLGAIDEVNQAHFLTNKSTITQDKLMTCIRELQQPGTAYVPPPLIQQIPHLICYRKGDSADARELLITLSNDISELILQIFQGQMASTVQCTHCYDNHDSHTGYLPTYRCRLEHLAWRETTQFLSTRDTRGRKRILV